MKQRIHYLTTEDGVTLAWADTRPPGGAGPTLVRAANWLTHLEYDWHSPVWQHWTEFFAEHFRYVRYDERGCGMTDRRVGELSDERWLADLSAVVDAAQPAEPVVLFGVSQGAPVAIAYAVAHPERVSHLILYGGYAIGARYRGNADDQAEYAAMQELARVGWDKRNPAFRQVFTSRFIPEGTEQQIDWFNELCVRTTTPEIAHQLLDARSHTDVRSLLAQVRVPTLVLQADRDEVIPISEGQRLAREIPGAEFVPLRSRNHVLLAHEEAWQEFQQAVLEFVGIRALKQELSAGLTVREAQILALLCEGCTNARIAERVGIAEKTVRNHLSHIYGKLGVRNRSEALVLAIRSDRGS